VELDAHSTYGVLLDLSRDALSAYEVFYSRQRTELQPAALFGSSSQFPVDVHYLHIGGETLYPRGDYVPFLVGGLGVTHMDPQPGGFDAETRLSLSLGGGLQKPLTENLGLRLETRAFVTLINSSESLFCADGRCRLSISGSGFWQFQMTAGLTWRY
jgi:hypothetical protein